MRGLGLIAGVALGAVVVAATVAWIDAQAAVRTVPGGAITISSGIATLLPADAPLPAAFTALGHPSWSLLQATVDRIESESDDPLGVAVVELGGEAPSSWSYNGTAAFNAASTYKLVALMAEAQRIADGTAPASDDVCFQDSDYEDGWFDDYADGDCFTRQDLGYRAGIYSDNTAGHMLVRDVGGASALNAFAAANGAQGSKLYRDPNTTTANDLATLLAAEARGQMGGTAAQAWLYPLLTRTHFEDGIPAGVPSSVTVVHKTGQVDSFYDDAGLVVGGKSGAYALVIMSNDLSGTGSWERLAEISAAVWNYEQLR